MDDITNLWREIVDPDGSTISQLKRYAAIVDYQAVG